MHSNQDEPVKVAFKPTDTYSVYYTLKSFEYEKLVELLTYSESHYNAFLLVLLKETGQDINKVLRILFTGAKAKKRIFKVALPSYLITLIKEAIILSNYKMFLDKRGFISIVRLSKLQRFSMADIDRQQIIRTFKKYNISYNYKR